MPGVVILVDVDGVVNPLSSARPGAISRSMRMDARMGPRLKALSRLAELVWVSGWDAATRATIAATFGLPTFRAVETAGAPVGTSTPNGPAVADWLAQHAPPGAWRGVVWIDDVLEGDAVDWAEEQRFPVHLIRPHPVQGLQDAHVDDAARFVAGLTIESG